MMRLYGLCILILLLAAGCLKPQPVTPVDPVDPSPVVLSPTEAAAVFGRQYSSALSDTASDLAARAERGEFESLADLNDEWVNRSKADRLKAQQDLIAAMNKALTDTRGDKPGSAAAELFRELAAGFKKGAGQ